MKPSPISAILLLWRNTVDTPSSVITSVFADFQSLDSEIASFISRSILRMIGLLWLTWLVLHPREGFGSNGGHLCDCPLSDLDGCRSPVNLDSLVPLQAVVVDPLTQRPIARHQQSDDGTTGCFHGIFGQRGAEPTDKHLTRQRVDLESPDRR